MFVAATAEDFGEVQQHSTKPVEFIVEYSSVSEPDWSNDQPPSNSFALYTEIDTILRSELGTSTGCDDEVCMLSMSQFELEVFLCTQALTHSAHLNSG